ncbi:MAG: VOC family protein [Parvibaculum sp.]|nr:VOC family protein [Parvibaculum sp.]|tara:strand:- start:1622 stop:2047 length:426 start_codon:yes stop_codon:yes gene_type:complete
MDTRISLITLGVADVVRARAFYERLGWKASGASQAEVTFFQAGGMALGLFSRASLAEDAHMKDSGAGFGGITLAQNVGSEEAVDQLLEEARRAGATILKPAQRVFWGGYSGYFADPDGHPWEVAYNPGFKLEADGSLRLPE